MSTAAISTANAEHYTWFSPTNAQCDAWYLVRTPTLNIIEELMPPGAYDTPHHHTHACQFFYVLDGVLNLTVDERDHTLHPLEGLEILPGQLHQAINRSAAPVRFLVTSHPPSHNDRIDPR